MFASSYFRLVFGSRLSPHCHILKSAVTILPSSLSAELFYTERAHVRTLKVLHNVFYQRVTREGILNSSDKKKIFSNLEDILGLHGKSGWGASWLRSLSWNSGYKYLRKIDAGTLKQEAASHSTSPLHTHNFLLSDLQRCSDEEHMCSVVQMLAFLYQRTQTLVLIQVWWKQQCFDEYSL